MTNAEGIHDQDVTPSSVQDSAKELQFSSLPFSTAGWVSKAPWFIRTDILASKDLLHLEKDEEAATIRKWINNLWERRENLYSVFTSSTLLMENTGVSFNVLAFNYYRFNCGEMLKFQLQLMKAVILCHWSQ